ncbi:MAG: hypothetical protein ACOCX9_07475 [Spirochaetota bacterium]
MTRIFLPCIIIFIFFMSTAGAHAGTFIAGAKSWFAFWESGVINQYEKRMKKTIPTLESIDKEPGKGFLAGPLLGYQTDNGKWSFGMAAMAFSYFQQEMTGKENGNEVEFDASLRRMDFDLAVNHRLNPYIKAIAGYKHQYYKLDIEIKPVGNSETHTANLSIPTLGIGFSYPLSNSLVAGLQLGILYVIPSVEIEQDPGGSMAVETENSFGFNGETAISYLVTQNLIIELGYRLQVYEYTANIPDDPSGDARDLTHGVVVSAYYLF